jgi:hypothetical protein
MPGLPWHKDLDVGDRERLGLLERLRFGFILLSWLAKKDKSNVRLQLPDSQSLRTRPHFEAYNQPAHN